MSDLSLTDRLCPKDDVMFRNLEGEAVLVNLASGTYFGLDAVGTVIWEALETEDGQLSTALERVLAAFDVERDVATEDLLALGSSLVEAGLVTTA